MLRQISARQVFSASFSIPAPPLAERFPLGYLSSSSMASTSQTTLDCVPRRWASKLSRPKNAAVISQAVKELLARRRRDPPPAPPSNTSKPFDLSVKSTHQQARKSVVLVNVKRTQEEQRRIGIERREALKREEDWEMELKRRRRLKALESERVREPKVYSKDAYRYQRTEREEKRKEATERWNEYRKVWEEKQRLKERQEYAKQLMNAPAVPLPSDIFDSSTPVPEPAPEPTPEPLPASSSFEISPLSTVEALPPDTPDLPVRAPKKWKPSARGWGKWPKKPQAPPQAEEKVEEQAEDTRPWYIRHRAALKEKFPSGWNPRRKLTRETMQLLRDLHVRDPKRYPTALLADRFKISPEAVRRILRGVRATKNEQTGEIVAKARWELSAEEKVAKDKRKRTRLEMLREKRRLAFKAQQRSDYEERKKSPVFWANRQELDSIPEF